MREGPDIAQIAALIGDPARSNMLAALMSGMALTAGELAREANVTASTASAHLSKLREAKLVTMVVQGRHRYLRLAGPDVAAAIEGLMDLAARTGSLRTRPGPRDAAMREARLCYDHIAGAAGVRLHDALIAQGAIIAAPDGMMLSPPGSARFRAEGLDLAALEQPGKAICRACLDWSERRPHLAGPLARAILAMTLTRGWAKRATSGRALHFSPAGAAAFDAFLSAPTPDVIHPGTRDAGLSPIGRS